MTTLKEMIEKKFEFDSDEALRAGYEFAKGQKVIGSVDKNFVMNDFAQGAKWNDSKVQDLLPILLEMAEVLKTSIVVESECDECGTFSAVRYEIPEISKALERLRKWSEEK